MTIYHIGKTMEGIRASFKDTPTLRASVDHALLRQSFKNFERDFPLYIKMRHAIGHKGELTNTPDSAEENALSGNFEIPGFFKMENCEQVMLQEAINGSTYYNTFEGEVISYDLNEASLNKIHSAVSLFMSGFHPYAKPDSVWP